MVKPYIGLNVNTCYFVKFERNLSFLDTISKNSQISNFKYVQWETSFYMRTGGLTDGRKDIHDIVIVFLN
jgi:hypothetical protein